jgi:hypothetical protein
MDGVTVDNSMVKKLVKDSSHLASMLDFDITYHSLSLDLDLLLSKF